MKAYYPLSLTALLLVACAAPEPAQTFGSAAEEACFNRVSAGLSPGQRLVRNPEGGYVVVTGTGGFTRTAETSQDFITCMNNSLGDADGIRAGGSITLTPSEQAIWDTLTDAQKREALVFMQRGGKLADFNA